MGVSLIFSFNEKIFGIKIPAITLDLSKKWQRHVSSIFNPKFGELILLKSRIGQIFLILGVFSVQIKQSGSKISWNIIPLYFIRHL